MNYNKQDEFSYFKNLLLIINWIKLLYTYLTLCQMCLGNFCLCSFACPSLAYDVGHILLSLTNRNIN